MVWLPIPLRDLQSSLIFMFSLANKAKTLLFQKSLLATIGVSFYSLSLLQGGLSTQRPLLEPAAFLNRCSCFVFIPGFYEYFAEFP
jgi:hypothetical protein